MKGRTIVLDHLAGREASAYLIDGKLDDLLIDAPDVPRPGAIFRAICDRPLKGQGGMMLRLPDGQTAFLRQGKGLKPGQPLLVQVTGYAEAGKAIPVTDRILFKSRYAIVTPGRPGLNISRQITDEEARDKLLEIAHEADTGDHGLILRSCCETAEPDEIGEDITAMAAWADAILGDAEGTTPQALTEGDGPHALAWREWVGVKDVVTEPGGFDRLGILDQIDALQVAAIALSPGSLYVETTRALVAADVNTGGDTSPAAALKANIAACKALMRSLRLQGLGGQIVVDFAPMSKAHRRQVEQALRAAVKADPIETSLVGWTQMGLFEMQRKRERLPLSSILKEAL